MLAHSGNYSCVTSWFFFCITNALNYIYFNQLLITINVKISGQVQFYTENVFKKNNNKNTQMVLSIHIYPVADCVPVNEFPKLIENGIFTEKQHKIL